MGWEILAFYFPDSFLQQFFKEYRSNLPLRNLPSPSADMLISINVDEATSAFFYSIVPYFSQKIPPSENLLEIKFKELLYIILSNPDNAALLAYVNSISDLPKPILHEIMEANFMYNLSLVDIARIAQRSLATFKRDFVEIYHTSPGKWLAKKKWTMLSCLLIPAKRM